MSFLLILVSCLGSEAAASANDLVAAWRAVFDQAYTGPDPDIDPAFDITGWTSSYTGASLTDDEMHEWVD